MTNAEYQSQTRIELRRIHDEIRSRGFQITDLIAEAVDLRCRLYQEGLHRQRNAYSEIVNAGRYLPAIRKYIDSITEWVTS